MYEKAEQEQKMFTDSKHKTIEGKLRQLPRATLKTIAYEGYS